MGQAKRRGTFEERCQQSIEKREKDAREAAEREAAAWAAMTDEERAAVRRRRSTALRFAAMAAAFSSR